MNAVDYNKYAFTLEIENGAVISRCGTGCLLKHGNDLYYVTAHHIIGDRSEKEIQEFTERATIVSRATKNVRIKPGSSVAVPDVRDLTKTDLLVFKVKASSRLADLALKLASAPPQPGETVYLAAKLPDKPLATYALVVLASSDEETTYVKIPGVESYTGASGGPIINASGELVGTYLGRRMGENEEIRSLLGTPLRTLRDVFDGVAKKSAAVGTPTPAATPKSSSPTPLSRLRVHRRHPSHLRRLRRRRLPI